MTQDLIETVEGGIATLTMNRPEARNAFSRAMMDAMSEALPRLAVDPAVRLVVITGAGNAFSAGGDVKGFARNVGGAPVSVSFDTKVTDLRARMEVARWLHEMPKPTLAVIPGPAAGAGLSVALACDLRIATEDAKLTTAFSKIGLSGDFGGSYFLNHLVGAAKARELYFTGQVISGAEAARIGLVNRVVRDEDLLAFARRYAQELAANCSPTSMMIMKRQVWQHLTADLGSAEKEAIGLMVESFKRPDFREGVVSYLEKRPPRFPRV